MQILKKALCGLLVVGIVWATPVLGADEHRKSFRYRDVAYSQVQGCKECMDFCEGTYCWCFATCIPGCCGISIAESCSDSIQDMCGCDSSPCERCRAFLCMSCCWSCFILIHCANMCCGGANGREWECDGCQRVCCEHHCCCCRDKRKQYLVGDKYAVLPGGKPPVMESMK